MEASIFSMETFTEDPTEAALEAFTEASPASMKASVEAIEASMEASIASMEAGWKLPRKLS